MEVGACERAKLLPVKGSGTRPLLVPTNEANTEVWLAPADATARRVTASVLLVPLASLNKAEAPAGT